LKIQIALSRITLATILTVVAAFAGCASLPGPGTVPQFTTQSRCERDGNVWYANLGVCSRV